MDLEDLLVYKVKRPVQYPNTLNKCFLKIMGCPFWWGGCWWKGTESNMQWGGCKVYFI